MDKKSLASEEASPDGNSPPESPMDQYLNEAPDLSLRLMSPEVGSYMIESYIRGGSYGVGSYGGGSYGGGSYVVGVPGVQPDSEASLEPNLGSEQQYGSQQQAGVPMLPFYNFQPAVPDIDSIMRPANIQELHLQTETQMNHPESPESSLLTHSNNDIVTGSESTDTWSRSLEKDANSFRNSREFVVFDGVFRELVLHVYARTVAGSTTDNSSSSGIAREPRRRPTQASGFDRRPEKGKRRQRSGDSDTEDEEERGRPPLKRSTIETQKASEIPQFIACPFWKFDPRKHWECFSKRITNIGYVKQHLSRRHTPSLYCQRCFCLFDDESLPDDHVLNAECTRNPLQRLEGVSQTQSLQLSRKSKGGSIETQWYAIWDILFPGQHRPASIYVFCEGTRELTFLREFSQRQGLAILRDQVRANGLVLRPGVSDAQLEETLSRALDCMFEHYHMGSYTEPLPAPASDQEGLNQLSDSGVSLDAQNVSQVSQVIDSEPGCLVENSGSGSEPVVEEENNIGDGIRERIPEDLDFFLDSICLPLEGIPEPGEEFQDFGLGSYPVLSELKKRFNLCCTLILAGAPIDVFTILFRTRLFVWD